MITETSIVIKNGLTEGAWLAQLVECVTLIPGSSEPHTGVEITWGKKERKRLDYILFCHLCTKE